MTRQQRRAQQRQQAKTKVINATPLALSMMTALHPALWQPAPKPSDIAASGCERSRLLDTFDEAQPDHSSKAGGAVAKDSTRTKKPVPIDTPAQRRLNKQANRKHHKHCERCGACLPPGMYRPDPHGLFNLSDSCQLCEAAQRIETGELLPELQQIVLAQKVLRSQIDKQHETEDHPVSRQDKPVRNDTRHTSGWPTNPFERSAQAIRNDTKQRQQLQSNHRTRGEAIEVAA